MGHPLQLDFYFSFLFLFFFSGNHPLLGLVSHALKTYKDCKGRYPEIAGSYILVVKYLIFHDKFLYRDNGFVMFLKRKEEKKKPQKIKKMLLFNRFECCFWDPCQLFNNSITC